MNGFTILGIVTFVLIASAVIFTIGHMSVYYIASVVREHRFRRYFNLELSWKLIFLYAFSHLGLGSDLICVNGMVFPLFAKAYYREDD